MNLRPLGADLLTIRSAITNVASASAALPGKGSSLRICNSGSDSVFIAIGSAAQAAAVPNSTPSRNTEIMSGEDVILTIANDSVQNWSAISPTSTTISLQVGEGN